MFSAAVGFSFSFSMNGMYAFPLMLKPQEAGAITAAIQVGQFALTGIMLLVGAELANALGNGALMSILAAIVLVLTLLLVALIYVGYKKKHNTVTEIS